MDMMIKNTCIKDVSASNNWFAFIKQYQCSRIEFVVQCSRISVIGSAVHSSYVYDCDSG